MSNLAPLLNLNLYRRLNSSRAIYSSLLTIAISWLYCATLVANTVIPISIESNRYPIALGTGVQTLQLCELELNKLYTISFTNTTNTVTALTLHSGQASITNFVSDQKIQFKAINACVTLDFKENTDVKITGTLSIGSQKKESATSRSTEGIQTDVNYTIEQLIKDIFIGGDCFELQNISYRGNPHAIGLFTEGSTSIDIERGVMLSTGDIANAQGPNVSTRISTDFEDFYTTDNDLESLLSSKAVTLEDVVVLEFDFTPTTNYIQFQYAFASEEYCDYVGSKFNDVFGFFLSGPGIEGPFENGATNIASVPGTSDFVAINNINHLLNEDYFVNNVPAGQVQFVPCNNFPEGEGVATELIEFDGFTTVLSATAEVMPCQTYHIKLAIADASDALFDSAVFLKANSFNAGGTAYVSRYLPTMEAEETFEGCRESYFLFERTDEETADSLVVHFQVSNKSTAEAGIDYKAFPDSVIILPGEQHTLLPINIYPDDLNEGTEHLIMELESACSCAELSIDLPINDFIPFTAARQSNSICGVQEVLINPAIDGGIGDLRYLWNTGDTSATLEIVATATTTYTVTITDICDNTVTTTAQINVLDAPTATLEEEQIVCDLSEATPFELVLGGVGPWQIDYTFNGIPQHSLYTDSTHVQLPKLEEGVYELSKVTNQTCTNEVTGKAKLIITKPESAAIQVKQPICAGETGSIDIAAIRGGLEPYLFSIDGGKAYYDKNSFNPLSAGIYEVVIQDSNGCEWRETHEIIEKEHLEVSIVPQAIITLGESYELIATTNMPISEIAQIQWFPSENLECEECLVTEIRPVNNGQYEIQVTDQHGCFETAAIDLVVQKDYKVFVPTAFSPNADGHNDLFYINASASQILEIRQFQVVNRWGDLLFDASNFQPNDPQFGWDGTYNGQRLQSQVLAYFMEIEFIDGIVQVFKGDVTLISE